MVGRRDVLDAEPWGHHIAGPTDYLALTALDSTASAQELIIASGTTVSGRGTDAVIFALPSPSRFRLSLYTPAIDTMS
jgi:hypothetical protein